MSKLKKFLLLIPTAFIMLLNCMSFTAFADDAPAYLNYFIGPDDVPELADTLIYNMDLDSNNPGYSKYLRYVESANYTAYKDYISGSSDYLSFRVYYFDLTNVTIDSNSHQIVTTTQIPYQVTEHSYYSSTDKFNTYSPTLRTRYVRYDYLTGYFSSSTSPMTLSDTLNSPSSYVFSIETNHPDFPVPDFFGGSSGGALNVSVNFDPEMSGDFQRREIINDKIVTIDTLNFSVTNNSKFSIQYLVAIVSQDDFFSLYSDNAISHPNGKVYSGDPTYVYVSDEWCYLPSGTKGITSTYCPSSWHHVDSGDVDNVTVNFNQMKLNIGVIYNVYVYAVKNTQDSVCVIPFNQDSYQYNEDYVLNFAEAQVVYSSQFTCSNPAEFDPNSNSGSYAFDGSDTSFFNRANGYIDENGNVVIDRIDTDSLISGSDSWGSQFDKNAWDVYYDRQNSVSSDLTQLSNNFSSFFRFVNKTFGYFPKNFQSVISLGLTSIVALGIIKLVIK